jgi:hypothetical protein
MADNTQVPGPLSHSETVASFEQAVVPAHLFKTGFVRSLFSGAIDPAVKEMYSIAIVDITKGFAEIPTVGNIDPHGAGGTSKNDKTEFYFTVPPRSIESVDPFTTRIVPTQNGGRFIESQGSLIRDIHIMGTTGLRPNRLAPAAINLLGNLGLATAPVVNTIGPLVNQADALASLFVKQPERGIDAAERTGYDDIMKLRNLFRYYSDQKKNRANSSKLVMLWRNIKDADYWVVEPTEFRLSLNAKSPMTYEYTILFKTISRFVHVSVPTKDPLASMKASTKLIADLQTGSRTITNSFLVVSSSIDKLTSLGVFAQDFIMNPMIRAVNGTTAIANSVIGVNDSLVYNWKRLRDNLDSAVDLLDSRLNPHVPAIGTAKYIDFEDRLTQERAEKRDDAATLLHALREAQRATRRVLVNPKMKASLLNVAKDRQDRTASAYRKINAGDPGAKSPGIAGSTAYIGNNPIRGSGFASHAVNMTDTIQGLSGKLLGEKDRWQQLALLNDLKAPYITRDRTKEKTLGPGDYIIYPVSTGGVSIDSISELELDKDQKEQSRNTAVEQAYGKDIKLTSDNQGRSDVYISQGDMGKIYGIPNVKQGIRLKFATERGELPAHPYYGAAIKIGSKMDLLSFNEFRLGAHSTIMSDSRVESVKKMDFYARGDILSVGAEIVLTSAVSGNTTAFTSGSF